MPKYNNVRDLNSIYLLGGIENSDPLSKKPLQPFLWDRLFLWMRKM